MYQQINSTVRVPKSMILAYILWFFLGSLGVHRFYLGRVKSGLAILLLTLLGSATMGIIIGYIFLGMVGIWLFIDLFLIPWMVTMPKSLMISSTVTMMHDHRLDNDIIDITPKDK
ncbi:TM2 domain-containing protein [Sulfoacidibacillus ferrooxidans]|uniref:TM2 domain-containing protein n=1 Tax=Sulfoacidibacillus ferrooxidans TaxID=2005001 RepID=A0A9X1VAA1_9BACL|nr:TM2 domain-containing protein [Sulfoacidibacillus ferrooxidans]MCI0183058.1 hypothetical protein [Sulfoacidibacillus ferrooxidans]